MGAARGQRGSILIAGGVGLAVIGLLIVGVLGGRELLISARVNRLDNNLKDISAAILAYQNRYHFLPGDDPAAATRFPGYWSAADNGNGDGVIGGAWNVADNAQETRKIWKHLRGAGFIQGPANQSDVSYAPPANAIGGPVGVAQSMYNLSGPVLIFGAVPGEIDQRLESRIDDGNPAAGNIQANASGSGYSRDRNYDVAFSL